MHLYLAVLEFIYAQSPESMKGLLTGLYYLFRGLCSIPSSALFFLYKDSIRNKELSPFYGAFTVVQVNNPILLTLCKSIALIQWNLRITEMLGPGILSITEKHYKI